MSNNFIFISGLWFREGFEMDDPISFYTQKNYSWYFSSLWQNVSQK